MDFLKKRPLYEDGYFHTAATRGGKTYFCHGPLKSSRMIFSTGPKKPLGIQVLRIDWRGQQYSSIKIKCQNNFCHEDRFFIFQKSQKSVQKQGQNPISR